MKRILFFVAISVLSVAAVLVFTYDPQTIHAIRSFNWRYAGVLVVVWAAAITGSALSFWSLARATGSRLPTGGAYSAAFLRVFGNLVTPFSFGGGPFAVFSMAERGVPSGKGSSIVITQMMVVSFYVLAVALASFLHLRQELVARPVLLVLFLVAGIAQVAGVVVTLLILIYPHGAIKLINGLGLLLARLHIVRRADRFKRRVIHDGSVARRSFRRYFTHHPWKFALGALGVAIMYAGELSLLWVIFSGLGYRMPLAEGLAMSALFYLTLSYLPTPGSSGLGEGVFVAIFAGRIPSHVLGIAVLLWRLFYSYAGSTVGAVIASHHFMLRGASAHKPTPVSSESAIDQSK